MKRELLPSTITEITATSRVCKSDARKERALMLGKMARMVLFFYVLLMFKPVMPLLTDAIAHTLYEKQHIMEVHEVNGKFHIHQDLAKSLHQSDKEKSAEAGTETIEYLHAETFHFKALVQISYRGMYIFALSHYPAICRDIDVPPPRCV